jgi:hypothetical protein
MVEVRINRVRPDATLKRLEEEVGDGYNRLSYDDRVWHRRRTVNAFVS